MDVNGECDNIRYATIKGEVTGGPHGSPPLCFDDYHVAMKEEQ